MRYPKCCPSCGASLDPVPNKLMAQDVHILNLLVQGFTNPEIARELKMPVRTIKSRIAVMAQKFGIDPKRGFLRIKLVTYWLSPLFQIGLRELDLLPNSM